MKLGVVDRDDGPEVGTEHGSAVAVAITVNGTTTETAITLATVVAASRVRAGMSPLGGRAVNGTAATIVTEVAEVLIETADRYRTAIVSQPNC